MLSRKAITISLTLPLLTPLACRGQNDTPTFVKAIIGSDNREPANDQTLASIVGRLKAAETTCNAFASAPNEVTTAGHCVNIDENFQANQATFTAANGTSYNLEEIILLDAKKDIAVFKTKEAFPNYLQKADLKGGSLSLVAIDPKSGTLTKDRSCKYEKTIASAGAIVHSCDTVPGESGAPLMQDGYVVGVHVGYKASLDRNVAFDLRRINDETVDMLSLELRKEGCHSRAHIRGGLGGHARAHVRDCLPDVSTPNVAILSDLKNASNDQIECFLGSVVAGAVGAKCGTCLVAAGSLTGPGAGLCFVPRVGCLEVIPALTIALESCK